jgi:predicted nucleotidyltransferase
MTDVDLLVPPDQKAVDTAVSVFSGAVHEKYGEKLAGVYLFGSRARGDHKPCSDVDLAVVIDDRDVRGLGHRIELSNLAYDVLLDTGAEIRPWVFGKHEWDDPSLSVDAGLIRSIKHDSREIWARS